MNYSEVKELLQAGFTADEIRTMLTIPADNPQNSQVFAQDKSEQSKQVADNSSEKSGAQTADQAISDLDLDPGNTKNTNDHTDERFNQLNSTMEKLIKTIQISNLNNNSFDQMKETDINTKVDEIMAGIIRPERKKEVN